MENRESEHQVPTPAKALLAIGKASEGRKVIFLFKGMAHGALITLQEKFTQPKVYAQHQL